MGGSSQSGVGGSICVDHFEKGNKPGRNSPNVREFTDSEVSSAVVGRLSPSTP